ncbi:MAG TPA: amidohydrolase/deacetylase family metallohydrolase [Thermomicrobiales bacterium]|nr:amidohydrolase/deacetylase family metallohydrolase [Thermomicrobiales bacterium]
MTDGAVREGEQQYDLVISGGHVIDPANGVSMVGDVAVRDGKIAAVETHLDPASARRQIDAGGHYVTPGLVDLHTHIYWGVTYWGIEADPVAARTGVTTWLDVGSAGGYTFPGFREYIVEKTQARVYALLNLSSIGLVAPTWEFSNPDYLDVDLAAGIVERHRDIILGIKARIDSNTTRGTGILPMQRARELADRVGLPLMTHIGVSPPSLSEVAEYLRPGDILTHCFTGRDMRIIGPDDKIDPQVKALKEQGLVLDVGHGTGSFSYEVAEAMLDQGIPPDVISSDIHQMAIQGPMFDLPTTLSKFINLGMPIEDVIAAATINAARAVKLDHLGRIGVGDVADVAIFWMEEGDYAFHDVQMLERKGSKLLVNTATLVAGQELPRAEERPLHFWAQVPEVQRAAVFPGAAWDVEPAGDAEAVAEQMYAGYDE